MIPPSQRLLNPDDLLEKVKESIFANLRVSGPGIIQDFNPTEMTVSVQMGIRETVQIGNSDLVEEVALPLLVDVPVVFPNAGGYSITFPIRVGDECLVVFGDHCIDAWWQSGGVQSEVEQRNHDLSDGFAIVGIRNIQRALPGYSTNSVQVRNDAGSSYFEISGDTINIIASTVNINAPTINANGTNVTIQGTNTQFSGTSLGFSYTNSNMDGGGNTIIDGYRFTTHRHGGVQTGGGNTGGVTG